MATPKAFIKVIEHKSNAREFLDRCVAEFSPGYIPLRSNDELVRYADIDPRTMTWVEYMVALGVVETEDGVMYKVSEEIIQDSIDDGLAIAIVVSVAGSSPYQDETERLYVNGMSALNQEERYEVLSKYARCLPNDEDSEPPHTGDE